MAAVKDKMQRLKANFTKKTNGANLGYKNSLKQGVTLFFFLAGTICVALMEINLCGKDIKLFCAVAVYYVQLHSRNIKYKSGFKKGFNGKKKFRRKEVPMEGAKIQGYTSSSRLLFKKTQLLLQRQKP